MYTLGINAAFHDPAAALVRDGMVVAAAEEERFSRIKHGKRPVPFSAYELPFHAVDYCLKEAGITLAEVDHIAYSYDPFLRLPRHVRESRISLPLEPSAGPVDPEWEAPWDPLFLSSIVNAPRHLVGGVPHHLRKRLEIDLARATSRWHFVDHHLCHSASAFFPSPFDEAAVLTIDGRGEKATTTYGMGRGKELFLLGQVNMPHSLGLLYEQVTSHLGFLHSSDEYKVMALASYGSPEYVSHFSKAVQLQDNGQYTVDTSELWAALGPGRVSGEPITKRHADIAHSLQVSIEEAVLHLAEWLRRVTLTENLCMAGGVALNCVLNSRIRDRGSFKRMWVQPAAGDAGTALGAALYIDIEERGGDRLFRMDHAYLGPEYEDAYVEHLLRECGISFQRQENVASQTADLLVDGKIVGWFQGRMEFGPRALGARSILASPIDGETQTRLNMIKEREDFRPVAPAVIEEEAGQWFRTNGSPSPFMLFVHDVLPEKSHLIPAVCHIDNTARIQTVNRTQNPLYYDLLRAFQARTGIPILVNTSFNTRNHPIVCSPLEALESFWTSPIDVLVIGAYLVKKQ
jgi:carbamoyltransferase